MKVLVAMPPYRHDVRPAYKQEASRKIAQFVTQEGRHAFYLKQTEAGTLSKSDYMAKLPDKIHLSTEHW